MLKVYSAAVLMNTRKYHSSGNRCLTINESRTMKKIYSFMVAAVALFAAASCNKELPQENLPTVGETVVYTASTDGADTKAVLNETTKKSEWVENDAITVHDGEKGWTFTTAEAGANVDFSNSEGFGAYRPVLAVYPAGTYAVDVNDKTVNAYIPTYQPARKGTYNEGAALAVAYSENDQFAFRNAHALIKFTIKGTNIKAVEFYGNNNEAITGNMLVSLNEDNTIKSVIGQDTVFEEGKDNEWTGKGTWVKIYSEDEANGWCFEDGATYYAAVAPADFTKGVSINYILADDTKIEGAKKTENRVNLTASTILNIGELEFTGTIEPEEVVVDYWAVVGSMTGNWNSEIRMTLDGDWYVAENVKITSSDQFKFRANGNWDEGTPNRGAAGEADGVIIENNVETDAYQGGKNFSVSAGGFYSLYINKTATKVKVVKTGDLPAVENWGVCGTFTGNWDVTASLAMTALGDGWYVLENVEIYKDDEFKFVIDKGWSNSLGAEGAVLTAETGKEYALTSSDSQNIKVNKNGRFTISLNPTDKKFKVECVEEYSDLTVNITIDNKANWSPLYIYLEADGEAITPAEGALVLNNIYAVSGDYIGSTLTCKLISGSKVSEVMNVAVTKNGATVTLEETIIKLKVQLNTDNAKQWWGNTMKIHVWNTGTSFDTNWPGNTMTSEGNYTWSIIVPSELVGKTINYLVHNGNGWQSSNATVTISASGNTVTGSSIGIN